MLKKILIGIAAVIVIFLVIVQMQPANFKISRSTEISAKPEFIFPYLADLHQFGAWSPWEKIDPNMKQTFSGEASGVGAVYSWDGNSKVGAGRMTITDIKPNEQVLIKLEFFKPFAGTNVTEFALKPDDKGTQVSWTMSGKKNFFSKAMCIFMSMDKMVGPQFESGLAQLKTLSESAAADAAKKAAEAAPKAKAPKARMAKKKK